MPDLRLSGTIGEDVTAAEVVAFLERHRGPVGLLVNSPGGIVDQGLEIADAIRRHGQVTATCVGMAASIASYIYVSAKRRIMAADAVLMIHAPWGAARGNAADLQRFVRQLDVLQQAMVNGYAAASGQPEDVVADWLATETWFTATEAVAAGLAHEIAGAADRRAVAGLRLPAFEHRPPALLALLAPAGMVPAHLEDRSMATALDEAADDAADLSPAQARAELRRVKEITRMVASVKLPQAFGQKLIDDGTPIEQARAATIDALAQRQIDEQGQEPKVKLHVQPGSYDSGPDSLTSCIGTAIAHRLNPAVAMDDRARQFRGLRFPQALAAVLDARGVRHGPSDRDTVMAALTTSDLPGILADSINKAMLPAFERARSALIAVAYKDSVRDFKVASRHRLGEFPPMLPVLEHGEYRYGGVAESKETLQAQKYGRMLAYTYEAGVNDHLSALAGSVNAAALSAASLEADLLAKAVTDNPAMADGNAVFHANHSNLAGTGGAPSVTTVGAMRAAMRLQKGLDGSTILNLAPTTIVVPAALETTALQVVSQIYPTKTTDSNASLSNLAVIAEPRLDASSATAWYLFANPTTAPSLSIAYLDGEEGPTVETRDGWSIDAVEIKIRWTLAPFWADWRGAAKNPG